MTFQSGPHLRSPLASEAIYMRSRDASAGEGELKCPIPNSQSKLKVFYLWAEAIRKLFLPTISVMRIFLPFLMTAFVSAYFAPKSANASHSMGADLAYECLGGDSFLVRLNFYRDCGGILPSTSTTINVASASCSQLLSNLTLDLAPSTPTNPNPRELDKLCPAQTAMSTCNSGTIPGVEVWTYEGIVVLPAQCSDWIISYSLCCRNDSIRNLSTPSSYDIYVQAMLNNTAGLCNNSPVFTTDPVPYVCLKNTFYNHGAVDMDGDSLVYTLINPLSGNSPIPYSNTGFSPANPFSTVNGFLFNPVTGQMEFQPTRRESVVVAVLVEEYRNGVLIGSTMRDIQIVIFNNSFCSTPTVSGAGNLSGGVMIDSVTIQACPQDQITFEFTIFDSIVTQNVTVTSNIAQAIPGASLTFTGSGNSYTYFFSWTPTGADTAVNVFTVTAKNDACPIRGEVNVAFQIYILAGTDAGPDLNYCPAGGPIRLNVVGGSSFNWQPAAGLSDPTVRNPLASPAVTTDYIVTSDLTGQCNNIDTMTVFVVPDFVWQVSSPDTICLYGSAMLNVTTDPMWAPYSYSWSPAASLSDPSSPNPIAFPDVTTTYNVSVTSDTGCTVRDSTIVVLSGVGPVVEVAADRNFVCPGDSVQLQGIVYPLACGESMNGCSPQNLPVPKTFGTGNATTYFATPFYGSSEDSRFQMLYLASDLIADGISTGTITRIVFDIGSKASTGVYQNFTIKMGCTNATSLNSNNWETASTVVYGPTVYITSLGSNNFPFSTPFDWDGRSNLVVEICFNNPDTLSANGDDLLMTVSSNYTSSMRNYDNGVDGCTLSPLFTYSRLPVTVFYICDPLLTGYTFSWSPATGLSDPSIIAPIAEINGPVTYTLTVADISCEGSGIITLDIDNSYGIDASPDTTICGNNPVQLKAVEIGLPPFSTLSCGVNGTQCTNTPITKQIGFSALNTTTSTPYRGFYTDGRVQFLYMASDLRAAGISGSGTISEIAFSVSAKNSTRPYADLTVKMGCTTLNELPSSFIPGLTPVTNPVSYNTVLGWNTHVFDYPYDWDGVSNIIVEVCFDDDYPYTSYDQINYTSTPGGTTVLQDQQDNDIGCALNFPLTSNLRPNIRFTFCAAPPGVTTAVWSPAGTLDDPNSKNPVARPSVTTTYTVEYTFINGCTRIDSVTVNVGAFIASASADTAFCIGESAQLHVTGGDLIYWDSLPGLSCYACRSPVATPDTSTIYTVTITDATGNCIRRDTVSITVFEPPPIKFYNDSLYCFVASLNLDAGDGFASYSWSTNATTRNIIITSPGVYSVTTTDSNGCVQSDSILLENNNPPTVDLGSDQISCLGDSITFHAGVGFVAYSWNTLSADSVITVYATGAYTVTVADANSCPAIDTVIATFSTPNVNFGPDATLCAGDTLTLIAGPSVHDYLWSDATTDTFIVTTVAGLYAVTATDSLNCISVDSITLDYHPDNAVDIGPDKTTCNNRTVMFNAGSGYQSYAWSDGSAGQSIAVSAGGTYSVTVVDVNNCAYMDAALLTDETPTVNLGSDTSICHGESVTFNVYNPAFSAYQWNNGSDSSEITVSASDEYSVTVMQGNNCTATDNVRLTVNPLPQPDLGASGVVCPGYILYPGSFETYSWNNASTDTILFAEESGIYSVTVTDKNGCSNTDSVDLDVLESNLAIDDGLLCDIGDSVILSAPDTGIISYAWSTGSTASSIAVKEAGAYTVIVEYIRNGTRCRDYDTAVVSFDSLEVVATSAPVFIGSGDSSRLNADIINGSGYYSINWTPAETLNAPDSQTPSAAPSVNTTYTVVVTDLETGCTATDTTVVIVDSRFTMPEAFTPNHDGSNDEFKIVRTGHITVKEFRIYNRWGEKIFETTNPDTGWNGTYNGKEQAVGTYTYYAVVMLANGETKTQSGVFSLLR